MTTLSLFEGFGIEIEYMIVDRERLDVLPVSDSVLHDAAGSYVNEVERGPLAWSNELALHVIELKTNGPSPTLAGLGSAFQAGVDEVNAVLARGNGMLMPGAAHPWMDPFTETRLWPHEYNPIYESYNRIFDCRGHGWSNLQSMHINLPFNGADEFVRLHAAIRGLLPLMPALAASSPFADGRRQPWLDFRMHAYRGNAARIPSITGQVVPEAVAGIDDYHRLILEPMYRDIAPQDPDGILQEEWLNSRGAIARFDRSAIEIRVLDTQECPRADIAVAAAVAAGVRALTEGAIGDLERLQELPTERLAAVLEHCVRDADGAEISDPAYLSALGIGNGASAAAATCWKQLVERAPPAAEFGPPLDNILSRGCLARRIAEAAGDVADAGDLDRVYRALGARLASGELFTGET